MSSNFITLLRRDDGSSVGPPMIGLIVALMVLLVVGVCLIFTLLFMRRRRRRARMQELSLQIEKRSSYSSSGSSPRRGMKVATDSAHVYHEKQALMQESDEPDSPIPEIRVTLPEEFDESGKRISGRVVTVHANGNGVGYSPVLGHPPGYQQQDHERFQSLDLERIGGLVEKANNPPHAWK